MQSKPSGATLDYYRRKKWERRRLLFHAFGLALVAIGGTSFLIQSVQKGRLEKLKFFGTVTLDGEPILFCSVVFIFALVLTGMAAGARFLWRTANALR